MIETIYTCQGCGCHQFHVVHQYAVARLHRETVECTCGQAEDGFAMDREFQTLTPHEVEYELDDEHRIRDRVGELVDDSEEEEIYREVHCYRCLEEALEVDFEVDEDLDKYEELDEEFWVRCGKCNREIEFGWSHPNRGGRIWTCEDTDFNPWKSWPEPRYWKSWLEKGWITPDMEEIYKRALEGEQRVV